MPKQGGQRPISLCMSKRPHLVKGTSLLRALMESATSTTLDDVFIYKNAPNQQVISGMRNFRMGKRASVQWNKHLWTNFSKPGLVPSSVNTQTVRSHPWPPEAPPVWWRRRYTNSNFQHDLTNAKSEVSPGVWGRQWSLPWRTEESSNLE